MKLKRKYIFILTLVILQTAFFLWLSNSIIYKSKHDELDKTMKAFSTNVDHSITSMIDKIIPKVLELNKAIEEDNLNVGVMDTLVEHDSLVKSVSVIDEYGVEIRGTSNLMTLSRKEKIEFASFTPEIYTLRTVKNFHGDFELVFSVGLSHDKSVLVAVDLAQFFQSYDYLNDTLDSNYYYVVDNEGVILFHPNEILVGHNIFEDKEFFGAQLGANETELAQLSQQFVKAAKNDFTILDYSINGKKIHGVSSRIDGGEMYVVSALDYDVFNRNELSKGFLNMIPMITTMMLGVLVFAIYSFDIKYTDYFTGTKNESAFQKLMALHFKKCPHKLYMMVFKVDSVFDREKGEAIFDQAVYVDISKRLKSFKPGYRELFRLSREHYAFVDCSEDYSFFKFNNIKTKVLEAFKGSSHADIKLNGEFLMTRVDAKSYDMEGLVGNLINFMETPEYKKHDSKQLEYDEIVFMLRKRKKAKALIDKAIEHKNVEVVFQPIFNIEKGYIDRHEVLMRINEDGQLLPPKLYIELAENEGKISALNALVVRKTFLYYSKVAYQSGVDLKLNINVSGQDINERFVDYVLRMRDKFQVKRDKITFEITETRSYELDDDFYNQLDRLKMEGFFIAIDDFGTGFANIEQLGKFKADYLKIDGSFIIDLHKSHEKQRLLMSILEIAAIYKLDVVAEYVESKETFEVLKMLNVKYAQGFYLGRPQETPAFR